MIKLIKSLLVETKAFGFITKVILLTLVVLITCTCSGPRLMLGNQIIEKPIDYSLYSGKLARQINVVTGCAILKTDVLGFHLWHPEKWLIWQPYPLTLDMVYYPSLGQMLRPCSQIRWYPYRLITPSFSNRYKMVWTDQRRSLPTEYQPANSRGVRYSQTNRKKTYKVSTPRSIGRTQVITPTTVRNSNSLYMTNRVNGKGRTTYSTTGVSRKPR